ncbi:MAG: type III-B CRISPR module RAMP protein Cmr6 [Dorea sp.]|nr:type III-B CRISPR module RAMP protein Cmr6 [Dorea sp.]
MDGQRFQSRNMNYIYYKEYFQDVTDFMALNGELSRKTAAITGFTYEGEMDNIRILKEMYEKEGHPLERVELAVSYPGLLIGIGIPHDLKGQGGISGGFSFDYVSGMPYIAGSELKGVLRAYFPSMRRENQSEYEAFIQDLLGNHEVDVEALEQVLFEGNLRYIGGFLLAKKGEQVLETEYFTPHKSRLRNPSPISVLKIRPEVHFEFLFDFQGIEEELVKADVCQKDGKRGKTKQINREDIRNLFYQLLLLGGIVAKRNVGFSQWKEVKKCS